MAEDNWPLYRSEKSVRRRGFGAFCRECGVWFVARITQRKRGGDYYCSRSCSQRVNGRKFQGNPRSRGQYVARNGNREHRIVAEEHLGRSLRTDEHVHHLDGDKSNNDPTNLVVVNVSDHTRLHAGRDVMCMNLDGVLMRVAGIR